MNNPTETSLDVVSSPTSSEIILARTNSSFIQEVVEEIIPNTIWQTHEIAAAENGFIAVPSSKERQTIVTDVTNAIRVFWDNARDLERQGYKVSEFKLQIQFKSIVAQTAITCDIVTSATERQISVMQNTFTDIEPEIQVSTTSFRPEDIPSIIDDVSKDNISPDLPRMAVNWIKKELEKSPNWTGDDIAEMSTSDSRFELYRLKIKPTLVFESTRYEQIGSSSSSFSDLLGTNETNPIDLAVSQQATTLQLVSPAFQKVLSSEREVSHGLFSHSIHRKYKPTVLGHSDERLGLHSLSMTGSDIS
ncbi:MAG: hypothetical protein KBB94_08250 [Legionellaceae bacterium]|nr:hypothetical protein [Legionellaceae bacterium]MBP9775621.1 hypothetical protein [Legionellaceae bacterium]